MGAAKATVVFEAHSRDSQIGQALSQLVNDGFPILKVGPGLTFSMREAFYGLDAIAGEINDDYNAGTLPAAMESVMSDHPKYWRRYVSGDETAQKTQRHFGLSDRISDLWPVSVATAAVEKLLATLGDTEIPWPLISQHLSRLADPIAQGVQNATARDLVIGAIRQALAPYTAAYQQV